MNILFFDTETTGFKSANYTPSLVQLGALLQNVESGRVLAELNVIVSNPGVDIPTGASDVHGITTDMMNSFGMYKKNVDALFMEMMEAADLLVAHNIKYDLGIIRDNLELSSRQIDALSTYCTMENSKDICKLPPTDRQRAYGFTGFKVPKLNEAYKHFFGEEFDGAHDAMADVRACRDIYLKLQEV